MPYLGLTRTLLKSVSSLACLEKSQDSFAYNKKLHFLLATLFSDILDNPDCLDFHASWNKI